MGTVPPLYVTLDVRDVRAYVHIKQEQKFVPIGDIVSDDITDYTVRIAYC